MKVVMKKFMRINLITHLIQSIIFIQQTAKVNK